MTILTRTTAALTTVLLVGCGALAAQTGQGGAPVACRVDATRTAHGLVVEGVATALAPVSGSYALSVDGPGTRLNQGGPLVLAAGETATLGRVTLGGNAARADATLTLQIGGRTFVCPRT
ncbi:hypothetical protein HKCCE3408_12460 [Rhodobacterales bacterium HKCCE3408]|nr:hypothetical protein [Rhodobacterales bacterium HKCCE3408]